MSDPSDGTGRSENIDVIRDLLRKLEQVAVKDGEEQVSAPEAITAAPRTELASLQRTASPGGSPRPLELPLPPIAARPSTEIVQIDMRPGTALDTIPQRRRRGAGVAIAGLSFAFGIACAVGIIFVFDPLKTFNASTRQAERQPASAPVPPVATTTAPIEIAVATPSPATENAATAAPSAPPAHAEAAAQPPAAVPNAEPRLTLPVEPPPIPAPEPAAKPERAIVADANAARPAPPVKPPAYALIVPAKLSVRAGDRRPLGLRIEPMPGETASLLVVVRNMPPWLTLTKGSTLGNEVWFMPAHMAGDLDVELGPAAEGSAEIKVQLATIDGRILTETTVTIVAARVLGPSTAPLVARPTDLGEQGLLRLLARGELLIDTGEVEAARTLLRTAAEAGSVAAALKLAETYDPGEVQRLGMAVASADPSLAARWYERAEALGSQVASARLAALGRR